MDHPFALQVIECKMPIQQPGYGNGNTEREEPGGHQANPCKTVQQREHSSIHQETDRTDEPEAGELT